MALSRRCTCAPTMETPPTPYRHVSIPTWHALMAYLLCRTWNITMLASDSWNSAAVRRLFCLCMQGMVETDKPCPHHGKSFAAAEADATAECKLGDLRHSMLDCSEEVGSICVQRAILTHHITQSGRLPAQLCCASPAADRAQPAAAVTSHCPDPAQPRQKLLLLSLMAQQRAAACWLIVGCACCWKLVASACATEAAVSAQKVMT